MMFRHVPKNITQTSFEVNIDEIQDYIVQSSQETRTRCFTFALDECMQMHCRQFGEARTASAWGNRLAFLFCHLNHAALDLKHQSVFLSQDYQEDGSIHTNSGWLGWAATRLSMAALTWSASGLQNQTSI